MGDVLGKVFAAFLGCILMFIVPIMLIAQKQDTIRQSYIDNAVVEFVDNAKVAGKITPQAYEKLCYDIDTAHLLCEIKITHSSAYTVPTEVVDPATGYHEVATYRVDYTKEEILSVMYPSSGPDQDYRMKNGDYISVEVKNISPTLGTRLSRVFQTKSSDITLFTSYGGYVGNNRQ
ncbi:hypothetical protein bpr_IV038 (plasmid) [Butyrivibrio proteoclasticus B316]|uniref:Uncharacterized protein n=1 Tax=Butyrivibrio proteoclasticus (strain ATCC 51982 / DSM 14932 / B316) TaxID=515622 RepID=E0S4S1_BUTPB|nr:hypothetical protein [Butyrivibrio proteoclasticus]ADL36403.1 hypothetical protein bpr_IV038 [Butyrivibrio proteoclasticus B316]